MAQSDNKSLGSSIRVPLESSAYLEEHRIPELLNDFIQQLLTEKPADPLKFLEKCIRNAQTRKSPSAVPTPPVGEKPAKSPKESIAGKHKQSKQRVESALLAVAVGTKGAIGPAMVEKVLARQRFEMCDGALQQFEPDKDDEGPTRYFQSKLQLSKDNNESAEQKAKAQVLHAQELFAGVVPDLAERIAPELKRTEAAYWSALESAIAREPDKLVELEQFTESLNTGPFKSVGSVVQVVVSGRFADKKTFVEDARLDRTVLSARVCGTEAGKDGKVPVELLFEEKDPDTGQYSLDFSAKARIERRFIYGGQADITQPLPKGISNTALPGLFAVYDLAETTLPGFSKAAETIVDAAVMSIGKESEAANNIRISTAPLKEYERAAAKAAEKYKLRFDKLLDVTRLTVECTTLTELVAVLKAIKASPAVQIVRMKNRINPIFSAEESAGYRDVLLNVIYVETGCICEIQVTLKAFLDIKTQGGHFAYKVGRVIGTDRATVTTHVGGLTAQVIRRIGVGLIQKLQVEGTKIEKKCFVEFTSLSSLASPAVRLTELNMGACRGLEGENITSLLSAEVCAALGSTLRVIDLTATGLTGKLAEISLAEHCLKLEALMLGNNELSGTIPQAFCRLSRLRILRLFGNTGICGEIPKEIVQLQRLEILEIYQCALTGKLEPYLAQLQRLEIVALNDNKLSGKIPQELSQLQALRELYLSGNAFKGNVPLNLAELSSLRFVQLDEVHNASAFKTLFLSSFPNRSCEIPDAGSGASVLTDGASDEEEEDEEGDEGEQSHSL